MGLTIRKDLKNNLTATTAPGVTDDASKGYTKLSSWIENDTNIYECADATIGAAVWKDISSAGGGGVSGDVVGPSSATDNAVARYDTATGKLIQNSGVIIDDSNFVSGINKLNVDDIEIDAGTVKATSGALNLNTDSGSNIRAFQDIESAATKGFIGYNLDIDSEGFQTGDAIDSIAVQGANYDVRAKVEQDGSGNAAQFVNSKYINSGSGCPRIYNIKARGTKSAPLAVQDDDILSCLITGAYDGTEYRVASIIRTQVNDSAPATGDVSADLIFYVSTGTTFEEVLKLDKDKITQLAGGLKLNDGAFTASEILALDASKNVQTLSTATYPALAELAYVKGVTSAIQTQIDDKLDALVNIVSITDTFRIFALTDASKYLRCDNASTQILQIPLNSSIPFPVGTFIDGFQAGTGDINITFAGGVTLNYRGGLKMSRYRRFRLVKVATDEWDLINISDRNAGVNTEALSANKVLSTADKFYQMLDPNGSDRDVTLPAEADGVEFFISNTGSTNTLQIKNDAGTAQGTPIVAGASVTIVSDGTSWFIDSKLSNVVEDTTPELGGDLNVNTFSLIAPGGPELLKFDRTSSAVNEITVKNNSTGNAPELKATGDDTNIDLVLTPKGTGEAKVGANTILDSSDIGASVQAYDANTAKTNVAQEYTATQNFDATTLIDAATINWDASANQVCKVTLAGNRTMAAPTNLKDGATYILTIIQDATGTRTITWNSVFKWPAGTAPTLSTANGAIDIITFVSDGTNLYGCAQLNFS